MKLIGIDNYQKTELIEADFSVLWDVSEYKIPEMNEEEYDSFYAKWLEMSKRENQMDEYGSLLFLQGLSSNWNKLKHRLIVKEKHPT